MTLSSVLIIGLSLVLLVYWFRASCILILRNKSEELTASNANPQFAFGAVQDRLRSGHDIDPLHRSLERDYEVFVYLVEHASGLSLESFEDRLLRVDYRVMQCWYRITRRLFPGQARRALSEMASIMGVLVGRVSEQSRGYAAGA